MVINRERLLRERQEWSEAEKKIPQHTEEEVYKIAADGYYKKPDLVRFLLIENFALKTILWDKGIINEEEYDKFVEKATKVLDEQIKKQIDQWRKDKPIEAVIFDILTGKKGKEQEEISPEEN